MIESLGKQTANRAGRIGRVFFVQFQVNRNPPHAFNYFVNCQTYESTNWM
jgi:hypothetical protein